MKKGLFKTAVLILIFALVCVPACSGCQSAPKDEVLTIVHATDMHFLSPKLTDYSQEFIDFLSRTDGKVTQYSPQICEAFVADMLEMKPDAVILSGDLTLNGAYESHSYLAAVLIPLTAAGIAAARWPTAASGWGRWARRLSAICWATRAIACSVGAAAARRSFP